jgi:translation initiation factor IF-3
VTETLGDMAVVEQQAKQEGKTLCMIFAPKGLKKKA